jgi:hypothetical protein
LEKLKNTFLDLNETSQNPHFSNLADIKVVGLELSLVRNSWGIEGRMELSKSGCRDVLNFLD